MTQGIFVSDYKGIDDFFDLTRQAKGTELELSDMEVIQVIYRV